MKIFINFIKIIAVCSMVFCSVSAMQDEQETGLQKNERLTQEIFSQYFAPGNQFPKIAVERLHEAVSIAFKRVSLVPWRYRAAVFVIFVVHSVFTIALFDIITGQRIPLILVLSSTMASILSLSLYKCMRIYQSTDEVVRAYVLVTKDQIPLFTDMCPICREAYDRGSKVCVLSCGHTMCKNCDGDASYKTCPMCYKNITQKAYAHIVNSVPSIEAID